MYVSGSRTAKIRNSSITGDYSVYANGTANVHGSVLEGTVNGSAFVGNSQIVGGASSSVVCAGAYDDDFIFYADACPN
jgi:hypothetical protein